MNALELSEGGSGGLGSDVVNVITACFIRVAY